MPLASHIQLPERYRVTRRIASGGMASVWEVEDLLLGRVVAIKVLGAQYAADVGARARFAREARTAARVSDHPNIATIYDIGDHGEDAFIVMEYFSGGTVADQLRTAAGGGRRVPHDTALRWLREAAAGLDHAHAAGVVHRDVKPANLLLDGKGRLAVADFGIARLADDAHMTQTGQLLGTAAYLSPEQAIGGRASAASDRYALAVVAYELLTGTRPFEGGPPTAQVRQHAEAVPKPATVAAPELPAAIDHAFERGLAKDPDRRPGTAAGLVDEIDHALREEPATERTRPLAPVAAAAAAAAAAAPPPGRVEPERVEPERVEPERPPQRPQPEPRPRRTQPSPPPRRRLVSPLVPVAIAAAIVGVVLAIALGSGGDDDGVPAALSTPRTTQGGAARERNRTTAAAEATSPQPATAPAAPAGDDPSALNDRGFELMNAGNYAAAVPLLRASVEGYRSAGRTDELGYAYALFNLGASLNRSGDPAAAVPILRERLEYANQRGTVQAELDDALAKLGDTGEQDAGDKHKNKGKNKGKDD